MTITRRLFLAGAAALPARARPIRSVRAGTPAPVADNRGDTWVAALASDGRLYSPSNDTKGFHDAANANVAFNRIDGPGPLLLSGETVNPMPEYGKENEEKADGCTWKSSGCLFLDGALYLLVARHKYGEKTGDPNRRQTAENASIIRSTNFGRTWSRPVQQNYDDPMFPGRRFATPYFVSAPGEYVYGFSNNGFWDNGDDMVVGRVRKRDIARLNGSDWEYYTGGKSWSRSPSDAKPTLERKGKLGMTGPAYLRDAGRYLMIGWYYPAGGGKIKGADTRTIWNFYEARQPWGAWTEVGRSEWSPQGFYCPEICPKWQSRDRVYAWTAGTWNNPDYYRLTVVPVSLKG